VTQSVFNAAGWTQWRATRSAGHLEDGCCSTPRRCGIAALRVRADGPAHRSVTAHRPGRLRGARAAGAELHPRAALVCTPSRNQREDAANMQIADSGTTADESDRTRRNRTSIIWTNCRFYLDAASTCSCRKSTVALWRGGRKLDQQQSRQHTAGSSWWPRRSPRCAGLVVLFAVHDRLSMCAADAENWAVGPASRQLTAE